MYVQLFLNKTGENIRTEERERETYRERERERQVSSPASESPNIMHSGKLLQAEFAQHLLIPVHFLVPRILESNKDICISFYLWVVSLPTLLFWAIYYAKLLILLSYMNACYHFSCVRLYRTLWTVVPCPPPGSSLFPWDSPGKDTGVGCHDLLQEIFLPQGSNLSLLHCRWIL